MADTTKKIAVEISAKVNDAAKKIDNVSDSITKLKGNAKSMSAGMDVAAVATGAFIGSLATDAIEAFGQMLSSAVTAVINFGTQTQKTMSTLSAMKNLTGEASEAFQAFNDVGRNTNYDLQAVQEMGIQLVNLGYSAQNAADLIQLCADTAAGLGQGQAGAQQLVDAISRIQATGEMSSRQLITLAQSGMDLDKAFSTVGMTAAQAMKAMEDGTLDSKVAVQALTNYMHEFDGSMAESKRNITDMWGDVSGNVQTALGEIGASIFDAFNQSGIIQTLIDFTQDLVDLVRSDGTGAFSDLGDIASDVLDGINTLLNVVITALKFIIITVGDVYSAFKSFGSQVYSALQPAIDALMTVYNVVTSILSSIGARFASKVNAGYKQMIDSGLEPEERAERARAARQNNFRTATRRRLSSGGGGSAGGGGGASKAVSEEERAVEALVKKYTDADKARQNRAKSSIELAKVNLALLAGEAKEEEEKRIKLEALSEAHSEMVNGYNKELEVAKKIKDASTRADVIKEIEAQRTAEENLYNAKVKVANFEASYSKNQKESQNILDRYLGSDDEIAQKIKTVQDGVARLFQVADVGASGGKAITDDEDLDLIAQILKKTPEDLQAELDQKNQTLAEFIEQNKEIIAQGTAAFTDQQNAVKGWADFTINYAQQVGDAMSGAMMDFITGAKSGKQAMADFVSGLLKNAAQLLTRWLSLFAIFSIVGDPALAARNASAAVFGTGNVQLHSTKAGLNPFDITNASRNAEGGFITGAGTGTSDSIPAMLSNGEYVVRAAAVKKIGVPTLSAINRGHFASGGLVGGNYVGGKKLEPSAPMNNLTLQVNALDASDFDDFLSLRGGGERIQNMLYEAQRRFDFSMG